MRAVADIRLRDGTEWHWAFTAEELLFELDHWDQVSRDTGGAGLGPHLSALRSLVDALVDG